MTVKTVLEEIDEVVRDVFDLAARRQAKRKEWSRRNVYERSSREVKHIAADVETGALNA